MKNKIVRDVLFWLQIALSLCYPSCARNTNSLTGDAAVKAAASSASTLGMDKAQHTLNLWLGSYLRARSAFDPRKSWIKIVNPSPVTWRGDQNKIAFHCRMHLVEVNIYKTDVEYSDNWSPDAKFVRGPDGNWYLTEVCCQSNGFSVKTQLNVKAE